MRSPTWRNSAIAANCFGTFTGRAWSGSIIMRPIWSRAVAAHTEELARSNRELEDFASIVAHDLRSPLLTISSYPQLLEEDHGERFDAAGRDYLKEIAGAAARMDRLIDDLLEYSRAGRSGGTVSAGQHALGPGSSHGKPGGFDPGARAADRRGPAAHGHRRSNPVGSTVSEPDRQRHQVLQRAHALGSRKRIAERRVLAVHGKRQWDWHRGGTVRDNLPDFSAVARPRVYRHRHRFGDLQRISSSGMAGGFGWIPSPERARRFTSPWRSKRFIESCFDCGTNHSFSLACSK